MTPPDSARTATATSEPPPPPSLRPRAPAHPPVSSAHALLAARLAVTVLATAALLAPRATPAAKSTLAAKARPTAKSTPAAPSATGERPVTPPVTPSIAAMVRIPAGTFSMGSSDGERSERPVHDERVAAFQLDVEEVSVGRYRSCVDAGACTSPPTAKRCNFLPLGRERQPVNCVSHVQATAYCRWLGLRLPTEVEWEYAARGTDKRRFPWGNERPVAGVCWDLSESRHPCDVGTSPTDKSPFGVRDLGGSLREWTSSMYCAYLPQGQCTETAPVVRGAPWFSADISFLRAASRDRMVATVGDERDVGFRCAK